MTAMINTAGIKLGTFVQTHKHGHVGRVYDIHLEGCPQGAAWQMGQDIPLVEGEANDVWYSVLCEPSGAVVVSARDIERIEPLAEFHNPWNDEYFD
jgi:hypothetical protein